MHVGRVNGKKFSTVDTTRIFMSDNDVSVGKKERDGTLLSFQWTSTNMENYDKIPIY